MTSAVRGRGQRNHEYVTVGRGVSRLVGGRPHEDDNCTKNFNFSAFFWLMMKLAHLFRTHLSRPKQNSRFKAYYISLSLSKPLLFLWNTVGRDTYQTKFRILSPLSILQPQRALVSYYQSIPWYYLSQLRHLSH